MATKNYDVLLKILLVGDSHSCKSDLLSKYTTGSGDDGEIDAVGLDYRLKDTVFRGDRIKLQIWDTAGQERFRSVTSSYYRGSQGCLLAFNMRSMMTFSGLTYWLDEIKNNAPDSFQTVLVATNYDNSDQNECNPDMVTQFASEHNLKLVTVDLNNTEEIQMAFDTVVEQIMTRSYKRKHLHEESIRLDSSRTGRGREACFC